MRVDKRVDLILWSLSINVPPWQNGVWNLPDHQVPAMRISFVVWRVDAASNTVCAYVGRSPRPGAIFPAPANSVQLSPASGIAVDASNNLYIADRFGRRIVLVEFRTQEAEIVAGGRSCASGFDGEPAVGTCIRVVVAVAAGPAGDHIFDGYDGGLPAVDSGGVRSCAYRA